MINYLNSHTLYLAQLAEPLITLKTELLRFAPKKKGSERASITSQVLIPAGGPTKEAFDNIQSL